MTAALPSGRPDPLDETPQVLEGGWVMVGLFFVTIGLAVSAHNFLHLPPVIGMMTGLGILKLYGYFLERRDQFFPAPSEDDLGQSGMMEGTAPDIRHAADRPPAFNVFKALQRAEWDTLMFFYGIILCVGGLGTLGSSRARLPAHVRRSCPTTANILVGLLSALVDNIPVMFAVLSVLPEMDHGQWLLVTLTAGVGGSLLSIGSAAASRSWARRAASTPFLAPEVDLGHRAWLRGQHLGPLPRQRRRVPIGALRRRPVETRRRIGGTTVLHALSLASATALLGSCFQAFSRAGCSPSGWQASLAWSPSRAAWT